MPLPKSQLKKRQEFVNYIQTLAIEDVNKLLQRYSPKQFKFYNKVLSDRFVELMTQ